MGSPRHIHLIKMHVLLSQLPRDNLFHKAFPVYLQLQPYKSAYVGTVYPLSALNSGTMLGFCLP